ncbi:MAG: FG-GAP repeat protein [candidate division Zixibacteria bacterium]|nr:FG-GAP repeat protein [candidate division Zixibacteria bacterium]
MRIVSTCLVIQSLYTILALSEEIPDQSAPAVQVCAPTYFLLGHEHDASFGTSLSGADDVNGDGFPDFIIGASEFKPAGSRSGRAVVFSGATGDALYVFRGQFEYQTFGSSVAGPGDVDQDGFADLLIGASDNSAPNTGPGKAFVFSGRDGDTLYVFTGEAPLDRFGHQVSWVGDVNMDGHPDILVGAPGNDGSATKTGRVYVFSGSDGATLHAISGAKENDHMGYVVAGLGDVDGDGATDFAIRNRPVGSPNDVYVISGSDGDTLMFFEDADFVSKCGDINSDGYADVVAGRVDTSRVYSGLDRSILLEFVNVVAISGAGDVNADGIPDIVATSFNGGVAVVYVFSGLTGDTLVGYRNNLSLRSFGARVTGIGDFNNDGFADIGVGARSRPRWVRSGRWCGR